MILLNGRWLFRHLFRFFLFAILGLLAIVSYLALFPQEPPLEVHKFFRLRHVEDIPIRRVPLLPLPTVSRKLNFFTHFDIYRCEKLSVYIYPLERIIVGPKEIPFDLTLSKQYAQILQAILKSPHYVSDPSKACIFLPSFDTLNADVPSEILYSALVSLPFWGKFGENHLIFSLFPGVAKILEISESAIVAGSGFTSLNYRIGFHIPLITLDPLINPLSFREIKINKKILAISAQGNLPLKMKDEEILVLDFCENANYSVRCSGERSFPYPEILRKTDFCLVVKDLRSPILWDLMSVGCIPVIIANSFRLPFDEVIDWKRNAILIYEEELPELSSILRSISFNRRKRLKSQIQFTFSKYFKSMKDLTMATLQILHDRIFSHEAKSLIDWNRNPMNTFENSPIFEPILAPKGSGFTAVVLAYDRLRSLFEVLETLALVPSLTKILVIWNNQKTPPPTRSHWPKIGKPLKVIQTRANVMSNRFFPYKEITTEAVLSLDDDITMLTPDEIQFGFEVWREFPDRLVGFPSRTHVWDNSSLRWKYESEWTNQISMVLTGAAFYHKYWHDAYQTRIPSSIRSWVDEKMNCEDIAMNFLVSHETRKAPIKITPRKKFKCPTCKANENLSADSGHMAERTECINKFASIYGYMPLKPVEFRADPVLLHENLPQNLLKYKGVGSL